MSRLWWAAVGAFLVAAAAAGSIAVLFSDFDARGWRVLASSVAALLCGSIGIAGLSLLERPPFRIAAVALPALAATAFFVFLVAIWRDEVSETLGKWAATGVVAVIAGLMLATISLLVRTTSPASWALYAAFAICLAVTVVLGIRAIWDLDDPGRGFVVAFLLVTLTYLLMPVVQRLERKEASPGRVDVPPSEP